MGFGGSAKTLTLRHRGSGSLLSAPPCISFLLWFPRYQLESTVAVAHSHTRIFILCSFNLIFILHSIWGSYAITDLVWKQLPCAREPVHLQCSWRRGDVGLSALDKSRFLFFWVQGLAVYSGMASNIIPICLGLQNVRTIDICHLHLVAFHFIFWLNENLA